MALNKFLVIVLFSYLVIFAAFSMHRTSSGYRREMKFNNKFKKFINIYKEIDNNDLIFYTNNSELINLDNPLLISK